LKFGKVFYSIVGAILVIVLLLMSQLFLSINLDETAVPLEKKIYFADNISKAHLKVIERFNERYKGLIRVVPINLPFEKFSTNERKELFARYFRSKSDRIDVFALDQIWVPRFAKMGINLDDYISPELKNELLPQALRSCSYHDSLVALPLYIDISLMYYRNDLLKKYPDYNEIINKLKKSITWNDFIELYRQKRNSSNPFYIFQADAYEGLICIFSEMVAGQDGDFMEGDKINLNTPEARRSLQLLVDLVNKYGMSPSEVAHFKENQSYEFFLENNGIFLRGWPGFQDNYRDIPKYKDVLSEIRMVPNPHFQGHRPVSVFGGWNLMISKFSTKIPEAVRFLKFVESEEAQRILFEDGGYLPINEKVYSDSAYIETYPVLKYYRSLLASGIYRPFTERYTNISDVLSFYLNQAVRREISVNDALNKASEKINSETFLLK
jgi:multiple sugar transport system substrate-binding protein